MRYLKDNESHLGIYLVVWFLCDEWDGRQDDRKQKHAEQESIGDPQVLGQSGKRSYREQSIEDSGASPGWHHREVWDPRSIAPRKNADVLPRNRRRSPVEARPDPSQ